jgi:HK97 family phage prohead protease
VLVKQVQLGRDDLKAGPEDGLKDGEFIVYPSTFIRMPDSYGDVVAKGAFADGIRDRKDNGIPLPGLFGHRMDDPEFWVATALDEEEDDHGWRVHGVFDTDHEKARKTYNLVKSGRLRELSFAYNTLEEGIVELDGGRKANELRKLDVHEFSFVPRGANRDTSVVAVKSAADALLQFVAVGFDSAKAGRVLSAKNENELRAARDAIDTVLASLGTDDEDPKAAAQAPSEAQEPITPESKAAPGASVSTRLNIELGLAELDSL